MLERNINALVVEGPDGFDSANPDFNYFVQSEHVNGVVIKKRGAPAMLIHHPWERVQAEATGLELISSERWNRRAIAREFPDRLEAAVELRRRMFRDLGVSGRVGCYGTVHSGRNYSLLTRLAQTMPDLELVGEFANDILATARLTKDPMSLSRCGELAAKPARWLRRWSSICALGGHTPVCWSHAKASRSRSAWSSA